MRVAINSRFLIKDKLEGIGRYSFEIIRNLAQSHPEDEFILFFDRPYDEEFIFSDNIKPVKLFPPARLPFLWKWWFDYSVARALENYKVDVFFSPDMFLCLRTKVPTLLTVHDLAFRHFPESIPARFLNYYEKHTPAYLNRANHIITVSEFTRKDIIKQYGISPQKISVAYNDVSNEFKSYSELSKSEIRRKYANGKPYLFYLGAVHPRKNIDGLIRGFEKYKHKFSGDLQLIIAGRKAWMNKSLDNMVRNSPFRSDIHFLGHIEREAAELMAHCDAFVYVSKFEGFGIPILEAIYMDRKVICSNTSSMPEVAGDAAVLVDPFDDKSIASGIEKVMKDSDISEKLAKARRQQIKKFSWKKSAEIIYNLLHNMHQQTL